MAKLKIFTAPAAMIPGAWKNRVNQETHHSQADVVIVAANKAAAVTMLVAAGTDNYSAESVVSQCRMQPAGRGGNTVQALIAAGIVDPTEPGAYAYRRAQAGNEIARVDDIDLPIVAVFAYRRHQDAAPGQPEGLYVKAVTEQ